MNYRHLLAPIALVTSALPGLAAPFCHLGPQGFEFSNRGTAWKLQFQDQDTSVMGWVRGKHSLLLQIQAGKNAAEVTLDRPEGRLTRPLDPGKGEAEAEQLLADLVRVFALDERIEPSADGFNTFMEPFLHALNLDIQTQEPADSGDRARDQALNDYLSSGTRHGVGTLASVRKLVTAYRGALTAQEAATAREAQKAFGCLPAQALTHELLGIRPLLQPTFIFHGLPPSPAGVLVPTPTVDAGVQVDFRAQERTSPSPQRAHSGSRSPSPKSMENPTGLSVAVPQVPVKLKPQSTDSKRAFGTPLSPAEAETR